MTDQPNYGFTSGEPASASPSEPAGNGIAVAGFILGLLAALSFLFAPISIILGILGIVFGAIGMAKANRLAGKNKGMALWGLILGIVGIVLSITVVVWALSQTDEIDREIRRSLREHHSMVMPASRSIA